METKNYKCLTCDRVGKDDGFCHLDCLPVGSRCQLVEIENPSDNLLRLMEMGLVPGTHVFIERTAPLNSPYSLRLPGCTLAVRREDARHLVVSPLPEKSE